MIYIGNDNLDLSSSELIDFAQKGRSGDKWSPHSTLSMIDYVSAEVEPIVLGIINSTPSRIFIPWSITQTWALRQRSVHGGYQSITNVNISTFAMQEVEISPIFNLLIKKTVSPKDTKTLGDIFSAYKYPASGDVDNYVNAALVANPTIGPYDFALLRGYIVILVGAPVIDTAAFDALEARVGRKEGYELVFISETAARGWQPRPKSPNELESSDPKKSAHDAAQSRMDPTCDGMVTNQWELGRQGTVPDVRWEWGWHVIKIGCISFSLYYPEFQHRDRVLVEILTATYPSALGPYVIKMLEDCARDSAIVAAVSLIVFADPVTALAIFKGLFWECVINKTKVAVGCLDAEIFLVSEVNGTWH